MEWLTAEFFTALASIIMIDLVLAGDNAIVIGLAARNVPIHMRRRVIVLGTVGAIVIRTAATLAVAWLLKIPGLLFIGGILLLWISYKLLADKKDHKLAAKDTIWAAIGTILIADAAMGMDNVLAVAGAAHGDFYLVLIGLVISMPIVVWGSSFFVKLLDRFNWVLYAGAAVLAFTAAKMIVDEPFIKDMPIGDGFLKWFFIAFIVAAVVAVGFMRNKRQALLGES
jgi:YjbE family integral membrane protein